MNGILAWANAQPVWLQVVIGLGVFFVVLPAVAALLMRVLDSVASGANEAATALPFGLALVLTCGLVLLGAWFMSAVASSLSSFLSRALSVERSAENLMAGILQTILLGAWFSLLALLVYRYRMVVAKALRALVEGSAQAHRDDA